MGEIMKDNKGFWDRWAKRYDLMMSGDGRTYARIVSRIKKVLDREMTVAFVGAACRKREAAGGDGFLGRDDTAGKSKNAQFPPSFLSAGCDKPSICGGNV